MNEHSAEKDAPRGHVLVIEPDAAYAARFPDAPTEYRWSIECLNLEKCGGWQECPESHEVEGQPVNDGPWDSDESAPWFEEEEFEFHGVLHEYRWGHGWTVPFEGCVVASNDADCPVEPMRPGRWMVHDEWDDTYLTLELGDDLTRPIPPERIGP